MSSLDSSEAAYYNAACVLIILTSNCVFFWSVLKGIFCLNIVYIQINETIFILITWS